RGSHPLHLRRSSRMELPQRGDSFPTKGKLTVRWGRNAAGQATGLTARLPKEGALARWEMVVFRNTGGSSCPKQEESATLAQEPGLDDRVRSYCLLSPFSALYSGRRLHRRNSI